LKNISPNDIRITPATASHVISIFANRLFQINTDEQIEFDGNTQMRILNEIKIAIPKGILLFNHQAQDSHNPNDRQLEIYSYIDLKNINPKLTDVVKLRIYCRLSLQSGVLSLRTIQKNFILG
jgi:hypothetical protein